MKYFYQVFFVRADLTFFVKKTSKSLISAGLKSVRLLKWVSSIKKIFSKILQPFPKPLPASIWNIFAKWQPQRMISEQNLNQIRAESWSNHSLLSTSSSHEKQNILKYFSYKFINQKVTGSLSSHFKSRRVNVSQVKTCSWRTWRKEKG